MEYDFESITIGGGVVGLATSLAIAEKIPGPHVVLEKNIYLGEEQSGRNSGVLHAGHLYKPGTLKAKLCVKGNAMLKEFARKHDIPYRTTGKITVAKNNQEKKEIEDLLKQAHANGVEARIIDSEEIQQFEPNVQGICALYTPSTGIIEGSEYVRVLERELSKLEVEIAKDAKVIGIVPQDEGFEVMVNQDGEVFPFTTRRLINAAGLHADTIARMVNPNSPHTIRPTRGDYCVFSANRSDIRMNGLNVYPAPKVLEGMYRADGSKMRTVGTHLTPQFMFGADGTPTLSNQILVGPFAYAAQIHDDYMPRADVKKKIFDDIVPIFPHLTMDDLEIGMVGIQAKIIDNHDFVIEKNSGIINIIAPSPGLTASLAIADYVAQGI